MKAILIAIILILSTSAEAKGKSKQWIPFRIDTSRITVLFIGHYVPERNTIKRNRKTMIRRNRK